MTERLSSAEIHKRQRLFEAANRSTRQYLREVYGFVRFPLLTLLIYRPEILMAMTQEKDFRHQVSYNVSSNVDYAYPSSVASLKYLLERALVYNFLDPSQSKATVLVLHEPTWNKICFEGRLIEFARQDDIQIILCPHKLGHSSPELYACQVPTLSSMSIPEVYIRSLKR